jgi:hypothetical protein
MLYPCLGLLSPFLVMRRPLVGMRHAFAATLCEGEDVSHEKSRGHRALHGVLFPELTVPRENRGSGVASLGGGGECAGSSSECVTTRPAHVGMLRGYLGMPRERFETPNEDGDLR